MKGYPMDGKLYSVQYLRGLAALLVVIAHASAHPLGAPEWWQVRLGQFGVYLFFVISGFIMVAISGETFSPLTFLKRRAIRIVPLYWLFTTLAAVLALALPSLFKSTVFTPEHYMQSLLFVPHEAPGRGGTSPLLSLGWTLNYEVFFYLAFAALAMLAATGRVVVLTIGFVALYVLGAVLQPADPVLQFYMNAAVLAFATGAWIGLMHMKGIIRRLPQWTVPAVALAGLAAFVVAFVLDTTAGETEASFIGLVTLAAALVLLGLQTERSLPRNGKLELLGDASYATYLVHMFVIGALVALGTRLLPAGGASYAAIVAAAIVVSLIAGVIVHRYIELPMLAWFRRPAASSRAIATPAE
jgi:exopolysaccharide production protein ExoZ